MKNIFLKKFYTFFIFTCITASIHIFSIEREEFRETQSRSDFNARHEQEMMARNEFFKQQTTEQTRFDKISHHTIEKTWSEKLVSAFKRLFNFDDGANFRTEALKLGKRKINGQETNQNIWNSNGKISYFDQGYTQQNRLSESATNDFRKLDTQEKSDALSETLSKLIQDRISSDFGLTKNVPDLVKQFKTMLEHEHLLNPDQQIEVQGIDNLPTTLEGGQKPNIVIKVITKAE